MTKRVSYKYNYLYQVKTPWHILDIIHFVYRIKNENSHKCMRYRYKRDSLAPALIYLPITQVLHVHMHIIIRYKRCTNVWCLFAIHYKVPVSRRGGNSDSAISTGISRQPEELCLDIVSGRNFFLARVCCWWWWWWWCILGIRRTINKKIF